MRLPPLQERVTSAKRLAGQYTVGYGTLCQTLTDIVQLPSALYGIGPQSVQEGEQHLLLTFELSWFESICGHYIRVPALDVGGTKSVSLSH